MGVSLCINMKKGQVHLTETIAVIFIFFVLVLFGLIFYYKYQQIDFKEKQEELLASRAMETTIRTLFLPELLCSRGAAESEDNCIDLAKVRPANQAFQDHINYYFEIFSYAEVTLQEVYPDPSQNWTIYSKLKGNWTKREPTYFVVTLRDEAQGEINYRYGYLKVEVFS